QVFLHVEQREALAPDLLLIAGLVHYREDLRLGGRPVIMVGEQARDRGGAAAVIVLLSDDGLEASLAKAHHRRAERQPADRGLALAGAGRRGWQSDHRCAAQAACHEAVDSANPHPASSGLTDEPVASA